MSYVLINHGWTNKRPDGHWQRHLATELRRQGHQVSYPQFPSTDTPTWDQWSEVLVAELELLAEARAGDKRDASDRELIFVGHSLGCLNLMKTALAGRIRPDIKIDRALFVAPSAQEMLEPDIASFGFDVDDPALRVALDEAIAEMTLLGSDADDWSPRGIEASYASPLGIEPVIIEGAKHLALGDGWGRWQGVIDWVNDPGSNLRVK